MQNVHSVRTPGEVNHTVDTTGVQNANLFDTPANGRHWLEVIRLAAALDLIELIIRVMPGVLRKASLALK